MLCESRGEFFHEVPVKFRCACRIWVCRCCAIVPATSALRELNFHELSARECVAGVDFDSEYYVRRSSGLIEGGWSVGEAASMLLALELTEIRICMTKAEFVKFVPLRSLRARNPGWLSAQLVWNHEPHLSTTLRRQWEWRWRDALHWQERAVALLWTFGDDVGRLISEF